MIPDQLQDIINTNKDTLVYIFVTEIWTNHYHPYSSSSLCLSLSFASSMMHQDQTMLYSFTFYSLFSRQYPVNVSYIIEIQQCTYLLSGMVLADSSQQLAASSQQLAKVEYSTRPFLLIYYYAVYVRHYCTQYLGPSTAALCEFLTECVHACAYVCM